MSVKTPSDIIRLACRRCDHCGTKTDVKSHDDDRCILQCSLCGREYPFYKSPREERLKRGKAPQNSPAPSERSF